MTWRSSGEKSAASAATRSLESGETSKPERDVVIRHAYAKTAHLVTGRSLRAMVGFAAAPRLVRSRRRVRRRHSGTSVRPEGDGVGGSAGDGSGWGFYLDRQDRRYLRGYARTAG